MRLLACDSGVEHSVQVFLGFDKDGKIQMRTNEKFVDEVNARFEKDDILLLMCRSGGRSAAAVNELATAGFMRVYTI